MPTITGTPNDDTLVGTPNDDTITALEGNDLLEGGLGNDLIDGGGGIDTASYANAAGSVNVNLFLNGNGNGTASGADGNDNLAGIENIAGSAFSDILTGNNLANAIDGGDGNDSLRGRGGNDTMLGGGGNDFLNGGQGDDVIDGGAGFDRAAYFTEATAGVTVDLRIQGVAQNTGQGNDTLIGIEHVSGTVFGDVLTGDGGDNWIWASPATLGDGSISADNNDVLDGQGGNDLLVVGIGNHSIDGGSGIDTLSFTENANTDPAVAISLALQGAAQATGQGSWTIANVENLSGGTGNDQLTGDGTANILAGFTGNDLLVGGAGNDQLYGDGFIATDNRPTGGSGPIGLFTDAALFDPFYVDGNDTLEGGLGNDLLDGGGGIDTASYANAAGGVTVTLTASGGSSSGADGNDTLLNIENITGSAFTDTLTGNGLANVLIGGDGHDLLRGDDGNDTLLGGTGDDFLSGGMGDDLLDGGTGFDRVSYLAGATAAVTIDLNIQGIAQDTIGAGMDTLIGIEHASGTIYNDTLTGNAGDNWLWGGSNGSGVTGNDLINAGAGNDLVTVGTGNHTLNGDAGVDTLSLLGNTTDITAAGITFSLALQGAAQDTEQGMMNASGFENVSGSIHDDVITGDGADNVLAGDTGNDSLLGGAGNDTLYGDGRVVIDSHGGGGSGPITTFADAVASFGGVSGNDTLEGGLGDDQLWGGGGIDTASYANALGGVQAFLYNNGFGEAEGADGYDQLHDIENLTGSAFNDILVGNNLGNILAGGDGNDTLRGNAGNDQMFGGSGNDFLGNGAGDDLIDGGSGYDRVSHYTGATAGVTVDLRIQGVAQNTGQGMDTLVGIEHVSGTLFGDVLTGNAGDNWIWGSPATLGDGSLSTANNDIIDGQGGNDLIGVGIGNHSIDGGSGTDTLYFTENFGDDPAVTINLSLQGGAQVTGQGSWTITNVENLSGGTGNDALTGDGNANILAGYTGNDVLVGGGGNDTLYGDGLIGVDANVITTFTDAVASFGGVSGNDTLEGGLGNDTLDGGGGIDTASYANAAGSVNVNLGTGTSSGADGNDTLTNIENVTGSGFNDSLTGSGGGNVLDGLGGNDTISGGAGDDTLNGGDGNDFLQGDLGENNITVTGNDVLNGGNGNDTIRGGLGNDQLYGGDGNDLMRGNGGVDYFDGGADDGEGNGFGDRISFFDLRATQGVVADLRTGIISNDGFGNVETMVNIESLGSNTAFADTFYGNDGRNYLAGDVGDMVYGFGGNDSFQSTSASAITDGGDGYDNLFLYSSGGFLLVDANGDGLAESAAAASAGWQVDLAAGTIADGYGNTGTISGIEEVWGSELGDSLAGDAGGNAFYGGTGDDLINGRAGDDTINGGDGIDTASYANASGGVNVNLGTGFASGADGNDTLVSIENVTGGAFNDVLTGDAAANVLQGGDGDDWLEGALGDDTINGGAGEDSVSYVNSSGAVTVDLALGTAIGAAGNDTLSGIERVYGSNFADTLIGNDGNNGLIAGFGNDAVFGGGGNDLLIGGVGNDSIDGGSGTDDTATFYFAPGTSGTYSLVAGTGADVGKLFVVRTAGATVERVMQISTASNGMITVVAMGSASYLGIDTVVNCERLLFSNIPAAGEFTAPGFLSIGVATDGSFNDDPRANILIGTAGNDALAGGAGVDGLYGYAGDDGLRGGIDNDLLLGGDGNDILEGGLGDDTLDGGGGIDTATYANASGGVNVNLGAGFASGADGNDTLVNIENVTGSAFNDNITGSGGGNVLDGLGGNDTLSGGAGDDTLYGGDGDDFLQGDFNENNITVTGNDVMHGGNGNDLLRGGLGDDQFYGGANNDQFRGNGGVDYFDGGADDGQGVNGIGDRVSFFEQRATQGVVADLRTGIISNDGFGNVETMVGIESLGGDTAFIDTFYGNDERNYLAGGRGDFVYGFGGDDLFQMISATAVLDGGSGIDRLSLFITASGQLLPDANGDGLAEFAAAATAGFTVNLTAGTILDGYGFSGTVSGIENVDGSSLGDTLIGNASTNVLNGFGGDDSLEGGLGNDTLDGGSGIDSASYANALGGVTVNLYAGTATGADGSDTLANIENVTGSAFDDTLAGNELANVLSGGDGADVLRANEGNDTLYGGTGNDILKGQDGDDVIDGGAGIDRAGYWHADAALGGVTVSLLLQGTAQNVGSQGWDTLVGIENVFGTPFADSLTGDDGANWLSGSEATISIGNVSTTNTDMLDGQGGNDLLSIGIGNHTVNGGSGIDTLWFTEHGFAEIGIVVSLALQGAAQTTGNGAWTLSGIENLTGGIANDTLTGDGGANVLGGNSGNDSLIGGAGNDVLYGDGAIGVDGNGVITTYADVATISLSGIGADVAVLPGAAGNDLLEGGLGNDTLNGGGGVDTASYANASGGVTVTLTASGGSSSGADGNDTLLNIENILGGAFNDVLTGNGGANLIDGGGGHDKLSGGAGDDTLLGATGDDTLTGGAGDDVYNGGGGFDRASFFGATVGVTVNLTLAGAQNTGQGMDTLTGIENLTGTQYADTLIGDAGDNWLWGFATSTVPGTTGNNDTLNGGGGNDLLWAGNGNQTLIGGTGNDTVMYNENFSSDVSVTISLLNPGVAQNTGQGMWTLTGIENLVGGTANDVLTGDGANNILCGGAGTDTLNGGIGNDTLYGDGEITFDDHGTGGSGPIIIVGDAVAVYGGVAGDDKLNGGDGDDFLYGGGGNDALKGDKGNDTLYGGSGNDSLVGGAGNDRYVIEANSGADTITGFTHVDRIVFDTSSGITSFGQLTLTATGGTNTLVTWGNGNSILIEGLRPRDMTAADFQFTTAAGFEHVSHDFASSYAVPHDMFI